MKNSTTYTQNFDTNNAKRLINISAQIRALTAEASSIKSDFIAQAQNDGLSVDNTVKYAYYTKTGAERHITVVAKIKTKQVEKEGYAERIAELKALLAECYEPVETVEISVTPYQIKNNEEA